MPIKRRKRAAKGARKGMGIKDFFKSANTWLRKTGAISKVANALAPVVPFAGTVGKVAGTLGYGKRRRARGPRTAGRRTIGGAMPGVYATTAANYQYFPSIAAPGRIRV